MFLSVAARYNRWLTTHPVSTKVCSAATLAAAGDLAAQTLEPGQTRSDSSLHTLDLRRTLSFAVFGGGYTGCFNHVWLGWLSRRYSQPGMISVLKKQVSNGWQHIGE